MTVTLQSSRWAIAQEPASAEGQHGTQFGVRLQDMRSGKADAPEAAAAQETVPQEVLVDQNLAL